MEICKVCEEILEPIDTFDCGLYEEVYYECSECGNIEIIEVPK